MIKKLFAVKNILLSIALTFVLFTLSTIFSTSFSCLPPGYKSDNIAVCSGFPMRFFDNGLLIEGVAVNFIIYFVISFTLFSVFYIIKNRKKEIL